MHIAVTKLRDCRFLVDRLCNSCIYRRISLSFNLYSYFFSMMQGDINFKKKIPSTPCVVSMFAKRLPSKHLLYYRWGSFYNDRDGLFAKFNLDIL